MLIRPLVQLLGCNVHPVSELLFTKVHIQRDDPDAVLRDQFRRQIAGTVCKYLHHSCHSLPVCSYSPAGCYYTMSRKCLSPFQNRRQVIY